MPLPLMRGLFMFALFLVLAFPAVADVVILKDGRQFEGRIVRDDPTGVEIDAVISTIRTQLTLSHDQIESIERGELPEGFFDPPRTPDSALNPSDLPPGAEVYLEVPMVGIMGRDIHAEAVHIALAYARRNHIEHVVFRVNSEGGSLDEAQAIVREFQRGSRGVKTYALVDRCTGDALAVPLMCDWVGFTPTALVGGNETPMAEAVDDLDAELEMSLRSDLGRRAQEHADAKGRSGVVVRAMIDPAEVLAIWVDEQDKMKLGRTLPQDLDADRVIASVGEGEPLMLEGAQLRRAGAPIVEGRIEGMGAVLGFEHWVSDGDFGQRTMERITRRNQAIATNDDRRAERAQTQSNKHLTNNIERRAALDRTLKHSLQEASRWDPTGHDYATYHRRSGSWDNVYNTNTLTQESRQDWQQRTDMTLGFLRQGARAARSLKELDIEATKMGLETTYPPGELDLIIQGMQAQWDFLKENRNRRTK